MLIVHLANTVQSFVLFVLESYETLSIKKLVNLHASMEGFRRASHIW